MIYVVALAAIAANIGFVYALHDLAGVVEEQRAYLERIRQEQRR